MAKRSGQTSLATIISNAPTNSIQDQKINQLLSAFVLESVPAAWLTPLFRWLGTRIGNDVEKGEALLQTVADGIIQRQPRLRGLVLANLRIGKARYRVSLNQTSTAEQDRQILEGKRQIEEELEKNDIPANDPPEHPEDSLSATAS